MKFSAQEEYGLRCLLQIARMKSEESTTIPEISKLEGLTQPHVAKLMMILRKEGFIKSTRGQSGGYTLARPAEQIVLGDVLAALGGKLYDAEFCGKHSGHNSICAHSIDCGVRSLWQVVQTAVDNVVYKITLADLMAQKEPISNVQIFSEPKEAPTDPIMTLDTLKTTDNDAFPISLTEKAIAQVKRLLAKDGRSDVFLRLGVKGGGCSGLEYVMKLDTTRKPIDLEHEFEGIHVVCDAKSAVYLRGSIFDYTGNLIGGGFKFDNPNAGKSCGCGTSFMPKTL